MLILSGHSIKNYKYHFLNIEVFSFQASYSRRAQESSSSSSSSSDELPAEVSDLQRTFTQIENEYNQRKGLQTEASTVR